MLINCPKCGFSQPKDQYCAKCGIDMETFNPKKGSSLTKIFLHPALHIAIIFVLVFIAVSYIRNQRKETFLQQVAKIPKGPTVINTSSSNTIETNTESSHQMLESEYEPSSIETSSLQAQTAAPANLAHSAAPAFESAINDTHIAPTESKLPTTTLRVLYSEIDTTTLNKWIPKMQSSGQYFEGEVKAGELPNIQKEIELDRSIVVLDKVEKKFDRSQTKVDWFLGKNESEEELGLRTQVAVNELDRGALKVDLKVLRVIESTDPKMFELDFELTPNAGIALWGLLSKGLTLPQEELANPTSFFQILKSERYKNQRTEFTILYVFDRSHPK